MPSGSSCCRSIRSTRRARRRARSTRSLRRCARLRRMPGAALRRELPRRCRLHPGARAERQRLLDEATAGRDRLVLSFHGVPRRTLDRGDPYHCHCHKTARLLADELGLDRKQWSLTFQSRFGRAEWLKPYTAATAGGARPARASRASTCSARASSPIASRRSRRSASRDARRFSKAGGKEFHAIPCLNEHPPWIAALADLASRHLQGWLARRRTPPRASSRCCAPRRSARRAEVRRSRVLISLKYQYVDRPLARASQRYRRALEKPSATPPSCEGSLHAQPLRTCRTTPLPRSAPTETKVARRQARERRVRRRGPASPDDAPLCGPGAATCSTLLQKAEAEVADLRDAWLRAQAETDNVRKQAAADVAKAHKYAIEQFADDLLPVKDSLRAGARRRERHARAAARRRRAHAEAAAGRVRAARSWPRSIRPGEKFDPHRHQAMQMVESDAAGQHRRPGVPEGLPAQRPRAAPRAGHGGERLANRLADVWRRLIRARQIPTLSADPNHPHPRSNNHGQDHRHRPRHDQQLRRHHGRRPAEGDRELGRRAHDAFGRRVHGRRRDPRRRAGEAAGGHQRRRTRSTRSSG